MAGRRRCFLASRDVLCNR